MLKELLIINIVWKPDSFCKSERLLTLIIICLLWMLVNQSRIQR